jgi:Na+-driven multidrug efflux pump
MGCITSLPQEIIVLNLIAGQGYISQFFENTFWILVYCGLGHNGKGNLAAGIVALSIYRTAYSILNASISSQEIYMIDYGKKENDYRRWVKISFILATLMTILLLIVIFVISIVIFGMLSIRSKVLWKARLLSLYLAPSLFLEGYTTILLQQLHYLNRNRPIIVSKVFSVITMFIGK